LEGSGKGASLSVGALLGELLSGDSEGLRGWTSPHEGPLTRNSER